MVQKRYICQYRRNSHRKERGEDQWAGNHSLRFHRPRHPRHSNNKYYIQKSHRIQKRQIYKLYVTR